MRSSDRRMAALALGLFFAAATSTQAAVIYFKDKSQEIIAESYRIEGDRVIATLQSGQETSIPLQAVDIERTESMSKVVRGSAIVLDRQDPAAKTEAAARDRSLRDLMNERKAAPAPAAETVGSPRSLPRTPAGNADLFALPRRPVTPPDRGKQVAAMLRRKGLSRADVFEGTAAHRMLVEIVTASRGEVFSALGACAAVLIELRAADPELEAMELTMATSTRSRAGMFVLTPEEAEGLQSGAVTPAEHFIANVLF